MVEVGFVVWSSRTMASAEASLILRLVDQLSAPSQAVSAALNHLQKEFAQTAASSRALSQMSSAMDRQSRAFITAADQVRGRMDRMRASFATPIVPRLDIANLFRGAAASAGIYFGIREALDATVNSARSAQAALSEIGIKSDLDDAQLASLHRGLLALAPRVNQTTESLLAGVDAMVTLGLAANDAAAAMPAIGRAATATRSEIADLSSASVAAMQNMGVSASEIERMLDGMASAGNAGAFEMRDMAKYFPQLTASARALGMEGVDAVTDLAAALQIARRGAGDAGTAANNMANFLGKIASPEVRKNFKKFGVDVTRELEKAHKKGISPLEHFMEIVDKKTQGGRADLLGQLFGDRQVQDFVRPMLADFRDYIRIREQAERATGTVAEAYARRMQDANERLKALQIRLSNAGTLIGSRLLEPLANAADYFARVFDTIDSRVTVFDRVSAAVKSFTAGLGMEAGSNLPKQIGDMLFGVQTSAQKAGEELGRIAARWRQIGEDFRSVVDSITAGQTQLGDRFRALSAGIGELSISPMAMATLFGAGIALKRVAAVVAGVSMSAPVRLGALAWGLGSLAEGGSSMSAVDWASLAAGLTLFSGALKGLSPYLGMLAAVGAIAEWGPKVAERRREPKPGEPLDRLNKVAGYDITGTREDRLRALRTRAMSSRTKDDDAFAGWSRAEKDAYRAPPSMERPLHPSLMNDNLKLEPKVDLSRAATEIVTFASRMETDLSIKAMPIVDSSSIDASIAKAATLRAMLAGITGGGASAPKEGLPKFGGPRAAGGPVSRAITYLVGEEGPELFTPERSGTIIPNGELAAAGPSAQGGGGANTTTTTINISNAITVNGGGDGQSIARQIIGAMDRQMVRWRQTSLTGGDSYETI